MDSCKGKKESAGAMQAARGLSLAAHLFGAVLLLACLASWTVHAVEGQEQISVESRELKPAPTNENELSDDLKYLEKLEKLDQYWSEMARPRFGRSEYKQPQLLGFRMQRQQPVALRMRQVARQPLDLRAGSGATLAELINARLAQRYNSNEAY